MIFKQVEQASPLCGEFISRELGLQYLPGRAIEQEGKEQRLYLSLGSRLTELDKPAQELMCRDRRVEGQVPSPSSFTGDREHVVRMELEPAQCAGDGRCRVRRQDSEVIACRIFGTLGQLDLDMSFGIVVISFADEGVGEDCCRVHVFQLEHRLTAGRIDLDRQVRLAVRAPCPGPGGGGGGDSGAARICSDGSEKLSFPIVKLLKQLCRSCVSETALDQSCSASMMGQFVDSLWDDVVRRDPVWMTAAEDTVFDARKSIVRRILEPVEKVVGVVCRLSHESATSGPVPVVRFTSGENLD